ncbi:VWA domain-containing protein [Pararhizobium mangrovi]|uniref:VWA domain-containing protein n=2 Tax=Pararhizobium mangrovi TaxID=2590452 RepID=A0A506TZX4_9HYPH|nr:VWA domain-containing protein [Pararhizobium mangrovi]
MRVGPSTTADAIEAVSVAGVGSREDFYWTLHSVIVTRHEDDALFEEAFRLYWRSHDLMRKMIAMFSPTAMDRQRDKPKAAERRAAQAFAQAQENVREQPPEIEVDARRSSSGGEVLRQMDFAQMTAGELAAAKRAISSLVLPDDWVTTRRYRPSNRAAEIDPRATMRAAMRTGGALILPRHRSRRIVHPPLVVLADISGSMSQYTRIFLHFLHALTEKRRRVHTFLFGTRLTNVSRQMRNRDPDVALDECANAVEDWSGGTRIGATLEAFNKRWSRRVLGQGARVILVTDGLERESSTLLAREIDRLHRSCGRLIWLNPLLRFEGFEAQASGVRAMLPHVDEFRAVHNMEAVEALVAALGAHGSRAADPKRYLVRADGVGRAA